MFGCLKSILKVGILVLALISFKTIGGFEWVHDMWVKYHSDHVSQEELEKAKNVADISKAGNDYHFVKNTSAMGYNIVISEHNATGQKLAIMKNDGRNKDFFTQDDIVNGNMEKKLNDISRKLKKQYISVSDIKILKENGKKYQTSGNVKYVQFEAGIDNLPFRKIKGTIGVYNDQKQQERIIVSANAAEHYSPKKTKEYFDKIFN